MNGIIGISQLGYELAVAAIQNNQIDILVNLNGYFGEHRTGVFARRCAPVQVNYLGFPGTLGADYMDYVIADQKVIPETHKEFYAEKIAYLPHCYQITDDALAPGGEMCRRSDFGLPQDAIVFCSFNQPPKLERVMFAAWMQSDGHRKSLLNCNYNKIGIGYDPGQVKPDYGNGSWVQDFGRS